MKKFDPYALNKPCENCPFLKDRDKAIKLSPHRRDGIIQDLIDGTSTGFSCHKSVYSKVGGEWVEGEDAKRSTGGQAKSFSVPALWLCLRRSATARR